MPAAGRGDDRSGIDAMQVIHCRWRGECWGM